MEELINNIQQDILNPNITLTSILLKAKVLAYQLKNDDFKQWVKNELDGYNQSGEVPDYRRIHLESYGTMSNGYHTHTHQPIPVYMVPENLRESVAFVHLYDGIHSIEKMSEKEGLTAPWPGDWIGYFNHRNIAQLNTYHLVEARRPIMGSAFAQVVQTVRSRLQDFILEMSDLPWDISKGALPVEQIGRIFHVTINNNPQGGNVSTFDQRGQHVNYQYNAGNDINFGMVQNRIDLIGELEKLRGEFDKAESANVIDAEIVTDAKYQLDKAILQAKKPEASQKTILEHINGAKVLIESVSAASGLVTGLVTAAELVQKFFG